MRVHEVWYFRNINRFYDLFHEVDSQCLVLWTNTVKMNEQMIEPRSSLAAGLQVSNTPGDTAVVT